MSKEWLMNFVQLMQAVDEDIERISNPLLELSIHVTMKTTETACLVGGLVFRPLYHVFKRDSGVKFRIRDKFCKRWMGRGAAGGMAVGPLLTLAYVHWRQLSHADVADRCYRLRFNKKQLHVDRAAVGLGLIGLYCWWLPGMVTWVNTGVLYATFYNRFIWDRSVRIIRDRHEYPGQKVTTTP